MTFPGSGAPTGLLAAEAVRASVSFDEVRSHSDALWWLQSRPDQDGRFALMRHQGGATQEMTPAAADVGSGTHGYGGGAYAVDAGKVWYVDGDRGLHLMTGGRPHLLPSMAGELGALGDLVGVDGRLVCVHESPDGDQIVEVTQDGQARMLVRTAGFVSAPRVRNGSLAWLQWGADRMPWDSSDLMVAPYRDGTIGPAVRVAGGAAESVMQPTWTSDGHLLFISDRTGWWNLYRWDGAQVTPVVTMAADVAPAPWELGYASYTALSDGRLVTTVLDGPSHQLVVVDHSGAREIKTPYTSFKPYLAAHGTTVAAIASSPSTAPHVVEIDVDRVDRTAVIAAPPPADQLQVAVVEPDLIEVAASGGTTVTVALYPPRGAVDDWCAPLIVRAHPGPTAAINLRLDWHVQFLTSHGFAVADVDYRGSTGYGRSARQSLYGRWGDIDVEDCEAVAQHLTDLGRVRPGHAFITGASAGGYTALRAVSSPTVFAGAVARSAIVDPAHWRTVAPRWQRPHATLLGTGARRITADTVRRPVLLIHGAHDAVAPLSDVTALADDLRKADRPHQLIVLGGGHQRSAHDDAVRALQSELDFYRSVRR